MRTLNEAIIRCYGCRITSVFTSYIVSCNLMCNMFPHILKCYRKPGKQVTVKCCYENKNENSMFAIVYSSPINHFDIKCHESVKYISLQWAVRNDV